MKFLLIPKMVFSLKWVNNKFCFKKGSQDKYFLRFNLKNATIRHQILHLFKLKQESIQNKNKW